MFFLYFLLWVIFNGNFTLEIAVIGVVIAAALFAFTCKFTDYSVAKEKWMFRNLLHLFRYVIVLVIEIVKANFTVVHMILTEKEEAEPCLVTFKADLKTPFGCSSLANAITLTPGTITVLLEGNVYTVHCLDVSFAKGIENSVFVDMIQTMEEENGQESKNARPDSESRTDCKTDKGGN